MGLQTVKAQENAELVYSSSGKPVNAKNNRNKKTGFDASRIIFGGGLGLGFGSVTNVSVAPIVGYRITDNFSAGIGMGYQYVRVKDYYPVYDKNNTVIYKPYTANIYSPSVWTRYVIWKNIFAHLEYEHNFMSFKEYYNNYSVTLDILDRTVKYNAPSLLLGGGFRQPVSDRVSIVFMGLYDVIQDKYSPYKGTIAFRFGIVAGF